MTGRVVPSATKSVDDLFHTWALVGPEITRLGVARAEPAQASELRDLAVELGHVLTGRPGRERATRFIALADPTFDLLAVATGNERLIEVYRSLVGEMSRVWALILATDPMIDLAGANAGWNRAIEHGDADRAASGAHEFIATSHAAARRIVRPRPGDPVVLLRR